jgi:hypothetical protein
MLPPKSFVTGRIAARHRCLCSERTAEHMTALFNATLVVP